MSEGKSVCASCGTEFPGADLIPKLVVTRDERVMRELSGNTENRQCLACWLKKVKATPVDDLAMAILALLKRVEQAGKDESILEKLWNKPVTQPVWPPVTQPVVQPNTAPPFQPWSVPPPVTYPTYPITYPYYTSSGVVYCGTRVSDNTAGGESNV